MFTELQSSLGGGGGNNVSKFTFKPNGAGGAYSYIAFETSNISHFKSVYNSSQSSYADSSDYIVGYTNSIPNSLQPFTPSTLTNTTTLGNCDFDVDTTYTYLVFGCFANVYGRAYDIEVTNK